MLGLYLAYTEHLPSPYPFRLWTAIHAVSACAERRVWTQFGQLAMHPNLYVMLVGPPGVGKTVTINKMVQLLRQSQAVHLAPNDITKQGLLDALGEASKAAMVDGRPFDYHFLALSISELSNFMSKYDMELAGVLTDLYDCPPFNDEKKRSHDKGKLIPFPGLSFLIGTATQNLGNTIPNEMWGSGFMARVVLIYSDDECTPDDMFAISSEDESQGKEISILLRRIGKLSGPCIWTPEAKIAFNAFRKKNKETLALHNRLASYHVRRWMHLAKLCMVVALSEVRLTITLPDFLLAQSILRQAEALMPEIFKDMISHEDGAIYEELRNAMFMVVKKSGQPITEAHMKDWLATRVASHKVEQVFRVAMSADYFRRVAGTSGDEARYVPQFTKDKPPGKL